MNYIDTKYINLVSVRLNKFAEKKRGLYNFRCPYCGDSQKYKNKCNQKKTKHTKKHKKRNANTYE